MYRQFGKRVVDVILAMIALIMLLPILLMAIVGLLLTGEHEVFYLQQRIGHLNLPFHIWKFATMLKKSPQMGTGSLTIRGDSRVLPFGRILRATKLNELPQLINVLLGDMAIVGPRPQMAVDFNKYSPEIQSVIYNAKPGITGIGSIIFRDEELLFTKVEGDIHDFYARHIAPYKGSLEVWYLSHLSFWTDLKLIFLTVWIIPFKRSNLAYRLFKDLPQKPASLEISESSNRTVQSLPKEGVPLLSTVKAAE